nr:MAG TPA: hypothetical protein [Caudoviricetes sp.]
MVLLTSKYKRNQKLKTFISFAAPVKYVFCCNKSKRIKRLFQTSVLLILSLSTTKIAHFLYTYKYNKQFNHVISSCLSVIYKVFYLHK